MAANWFGKAAEQGLANAQLNLGSLYERGEGVEQNPQQAEKWYRLAAAQGSEEAQERLDLLKSQE
jgi:TPR repeat protein